MNAQTSNTGGKVVNTQGTPYDPSRVANAPSNYGRFIVAQRLPQITK